MVSLRRFIAIMVLLGLCTIGAGVDQVANALCEITVPDPPTGERYYSPVANKCGPIHTGWTGYAPVKSRH
jgi:hypothetical protein